MSTERGIDFNRCMSTEYVLPCIDTVEVMLGAGGAMVYRQANKAITNMY